MPINNKWARQKAMTKHNFIRVIILIAVLLLFFSQSVYDPSVYAKMQMMEDDNLSDVTAESLMLEINSTVRAYASDFMINNQEGDYLRTGEISLGGSNGSQYTRLMSNQLADVGSVVQQTWILLGNLDFPYVSGGNTLGLYVSDLSFVGHVYSGGTRVQDTTLYHLGNVEITNFNYGHNVTGVTPELNQGDPPFVMYSANETNGLEIRSEVGFYIGRIKYAYNTASALTVSGIYIYQGYGNDLANGNPDLWTSPIVGKARLGGDFPTYNTGGTNIAGANVTTMDAINIGSSGGSSYIFMNFPVHGSLRIKNITMGTTTFGPAAIDDAVFYRNMLIWDLKRI
jgi:hypothetical protein